MDHLSALKMFNRIVESGSFAKAADLLDVPRATATKLIQDLEAHVGVTLLARTTRRVTVTTEGAAYYERSRRLVQELEDMDSEAGRAGGLVRGHLRVDVGSSIASVMLIPALPDFHRRYPDVSLHLGVSDRAVDLIGEGVDCAIRTGTFADTSLIARRLARLDYVICATPAYLAKHGTPQHPLDIETGHWVLPYFSSLTGRPFPIRLERGDEKFEVHGRAALAVNESTAHVTALLSGMGLGQTFRFMAEPHFASGTLVEILPEWSTPAQRLSIVYPPNRHLNARLRVFVDWAVEHFAAFDDARRRAS